MLSYLATFQHEISSAARLRHPAKKLVRQIIWVKSENDFECPMSDAFDVTCHDPILRVPLIFLIFYYQQVPNLSVLMLCFAYGCISAEKRPT